MFSAQLPEHLHSMSTLSFRRIQQLEKFINFIQNVIQYQTIEVFCISCEVCMSFLCLFRVSPTVENMLDWCSLPSTLKKEIPNLTYLFKKNKPTATENAFM